MEPKRKCRYCIQSFDDEHPENRDGYNLACLHDYLDTQPNPYNE